MTSELAFIYTTFSSKDSAVHLIKECFNQKLIACANILPNITSIYEWNNKIETQEEYIAILKTTKKNIKHLADFIKTKHDYDCPCIVSLNIEGLNTKFESWIKKCLE